MKVTFNGEPRELRDGATVGELVAEAAAGARACGVAIAVDAEVVPRSAWDETVLSEGQEIELLRAVQGG